MAAATSGKEVITFQVGNYSNFVGAHYWNLQEALLEDGNSRTNTHSELNHDILFRNGLDFQTGHSTQRPRVIALDLKENIRNFALTDNLPDKNAGDDIVWEGATEKYDRSTKNNKKTNIDIQSDKNSTFTPSSDCSDIAKLCNKDTMTTWSDFALSHFHDKSVKSIESLHKDGRGGFDNFGSGEALFRSPKFCDDFEDRLHFFAEECDRLQGFQIFTDIHDGFAGLTSGILETISDDYAKKSRLCFATMPATFEDDTRHTLERAMLNVLLSFGKYVDDGCQVIPLSLRDSYGLRHKLVVFPHIEYKGNLPYHTSAILASAVDAATLPYRLAGDQSTDLNAFVNHLSVNRRQISALSLGLPVPVNTNVTMTDLLKGPMDYMVQLTPDVGRPENILTQSTVLRGIPKHLLKTDSYHYTARQMSTFFQYKTSLGNVCPTYIAQTPSIFTQTFPEIFKPSVTQIGCFVEDYKRPLDLKVEKSSVMACLTNCEEVARPLKALLAGTDKSSATRHPGFLEAGIEQGDIVSCREVIETLVQAFQSAYEF